MAIEKKILVCVGTDQNKFLRVRLSLLVIEDGRVISEKYHSINIEPGADLAFLRSENEKALENPSSGIPGAPWPKIPDAAWGEVEQHIAIVHKPTVVEKFQAARAEVAVK